MSQDTKHGKLTADTRSRPSNGIYGYTPADLAISLSLKFLKAKELSMLSATCSNYRRACEEECRRRCLKKGSLFHYTWAKLLRASEIVEGDLKGPQIAVPAACSTRRVEVVGAGIQLANGMYVNSEMGVNGRVFTRHYKGELYTIRKLYSGHQLFWYLSKNRQQLYWANVPFMEVSLEEGYPPRGIWGAFNEDYTPPPTTRII